MVRTGARASGLSELLASSGLARAAVPASPRIKGLPDGPREELFDLYRRLGGTQESPDLRPGSWDLCFEGGLVVELDEELHFNRYRAVTLESSWSRDLPWRAEHLSQCRNHEADCLRAGKWGKRWTNPSTARMFSGGSPGDLGAGAPRWKQRALYDAMKDLVATVRDDLHLARVSIYDEIDDIQLGSILQGTEATKPNAVRDFLEQRLT